MPPNRVALLLPAAALLCGCERLSVPPSCSSISSVVITRNVAGVETSSFGPDEIVDVQVAFTNHASLPATIDLHPNESCNAAYVAVRDAGSTTLWRGACPPGHLCACAFDELTLQPGETATAHDQWDQRVSGSLVPAGAYTAHAIDVSECAPLLDDATAFTLVR